jgi:hypothetical protein
VIVSWISTASTREFEDRGFKNFMPASMRVNQSKILLLCPAFGMCESFNSRFPRKKLVNETYAWRFRKARILELDEMVLQEKAEGTVIMIMP